MNIARKCIAVLVAILPSWLKVPIYRRLYGYDIGRGVILGFSPFFDVPSCRIGDHVRVGSFNLFYRVLKLELDNHAKVGFLNLFRGGDSVRVGAYATILRQNVFNAIIESDFVESVNSVLEIGTGAVVTSGHWLDFSAGLSVGDQTIVGGRNSSFWTHNRQRGRKVVIGQRCYLGSEIRVAPGVELSPYCIVALGSVLSGRYPDERFLVGGNPAVAVKPLREDDLFLVVRRTRSDLPDDIAYASLPDDLAVLALRANGLTPAVKNGVRPVSNAPRGEPSCAELRGSST